MLLGIDASKWQYEMNWHKARSAGARFAFIRAGSCNNISGGCYTDYQFERNASLAPDYMPIGFYWYFRPQHDPIKQADYFCSLIRGQRWLLPPVLDLEEDGGLSARNVTDAAKSFLLETYSRLNAWCLLYSRALWLNGHTVTDDIWEMVDVWIARYINLSGPWADGKCKPRDFDQWRFWQKSAGGNGLGSTFGAKSHDIDIDYFNGDQSAFDNYTGVTGKHLVRVISLLAASLRSGPEGAAIGATWKGAVWPVIEASGDYYKVEGWLHKDKVEKI
jgi:GH25 family lysozyme M1 (1,4-beta-N-acetylmuramidase)